MIISKSNFMAIILQMSVMVSLTLVVSTELTRNYTPDHITLDLTVIGA